MVGIAYNSLRNFDLTKLVKVGDRIVYQHNGVKTRRVQRVTKKSASVMEGDKEVRVRYDQIIRA
jgi:hypothetical protein